MLLKRRGEMLQHHGHCREAPQGRQRAKFRLCGTSGCRSDWWLMIYHF
jgi:hypothetical protein